MDKGKKKRITKKPFSIRRKAFLNLKISYNLFTNRVKLDFKLDALFL